MSANPVFRTGEHYSQNNFNGRSIFDRMYHTIKATLPNDSCDIDQWLHRVDLPMDAPLPDLADAQAMDALSDAAFEHFSSLPDIEHLARALTASSFYFALRAMPVFEDGYFACYGRILNRIPAASTALSTLLHKLDADRAQLIVQGRRVSLSDARLLLDRAGNFCKPVYFRVNKLTELVDVRLKVNGKPAQHISASPLSIESVVTLQRLDWPGTRIERSMKSRRSKRPCPARVYEPHAKRRQL